jgi:tRNA splicing ligase
MDERTLSASLPLSIYIFLTFLLILKWSSLEAHTKPPYTLTLKSNGCIIFIAALSPSQILITSKHSLGPVQGLSESHAQAGERWLRRLLGQVGKTKEALAKVLWEKNWTAVAEVSYPHSHTPIASSLPAALR